ncbi:MAG TPA: hypothetical protein VMH33_06970 [Solirubrobacterales bacterium]|nr:hypothetical protein [Solirubrobacterales bacterium]
MSETRLPPSRIAIAALLTILSALILFTPASGRAASSTKCPTGKLGKKGTGCSKPSRLQYKIVRRGSMVSVPYTPTADGLSQIVTVECPHEEHVLAGGAEIAAPAAPFLTVSLSAPNEATTGWSAQLTNLSTTAYSEAWLIVYAACEV